jgi:hypothetical protein
MLDGDAGPAAVADATPALVAAAVTNRVRKQRTSIEIPPSLDHGAPIKGDALLPQPAILAAVRKALESTRIQFSNGKQPGVMRQGCG